MGWPYLAQPVAAQREERREAAAEGRTEGKVTDQAGDVEDERAGQHERQRAADGRRRVRVVLSLGQLVRVLQVELLELCTDLRRVEVITVTWRRLA